MSPRSECLREPRDSREQLLADPRRRGRRDVRPLRPAVRRVDGVASLPFRDRCRNACCRSHLVPQACAHLRREELPLGIETEAAEELSR